MPATRSGIRQGSRQPAPYPQDVAGPSNQHHGVVFVDGDLGAPRKRQVVESKSAKQRSKQKAKAPLPPASEIIEISSDDEERPPKKPLLAVNAIEKRIKDLEEENRRLKAALDAAKAVSAGLPDAPRVDIHGAFQTQPSPVPEVKVAAPAPALETDKFLSAIEDHINCEVCTLKMWNPYTLSCGHTFCAGCLQDWFSTAYAHHLAKNPAYDPQQIVPGHYRAALARADLPPHRKRDIEREIAIIVSTASHPEYSCPTCRVLIRARPAENFVVKHLVRTIAAAQGESPPQEAPRPIHRALEGPFDGFFPSFLKFM